MGEVLGAEIGIEVRRKEEKRQDSAAAETSHAWPGRYSSMSGFYSKGDEKFILRKMENSLGIPSRGLKQRGFCLTRISLAVIKS